MPPTYTIKVKNLASLQTMFKVAPIKMTAEIHNAIAQSILKIERNAKREFSSNNKGYSTGRLTQSIKSEMTGIAQGKVEVGAEYGAAVETGTRPHIIKAKGKSLYNKKKKIFYGKIVHHPGTKPNPFFERGIDASRADIDSLFIRAVQNVLK